MSASSLHLIVETMEDRILHSADVAPLMLVGAGTETMLQQPQQSVAADAAVQRSEIVFVDAGLPDAQSLVADLQSQRGAGRPIEIVTIAAGEDGLALIGHTLAARQDISALHVLAHGSDGALQLGNTTLDRQTLLRRAGEVAAWSAALSADADLLLYGCDLAQTASGQELVRDLASLTGADVAASTDLTGAAALGGNWTLEFHSGPIESAVAPSLAEQTHWQGLLATYTVTNTADTALIILPAPDGSLRWAINQANANPGSDTINFASSANGTIALGFLASGDNTNASGDFDITDSVNIVGNGTANTVISGNGFDRVFDLRSGNISLSGLTVQAGKSNQGAGLNVSASATVTLTDVVVQNNLGNGASRGAGIFNTGNLTLRNVIVQNNGDSSSGDAQGAGIYIDKGGVVDAQDVEIRGNNADAADGGGLYAKDDATMTFKNATFAENSARNGGGLWLKKEGTSLLNVTLSGNAASSQGGGLWAEKGAALDHVTVAYNAASSGGGVFDNGGNVTLANSLFVGNTGGNTSNLRNSLDYNLSDDNSTGFTAAHDLSNVAVVLSPLANNGGFTRTHGIAADSAARDAANPVTALTTDQRGVLYQGARADIGAFEYNPFGQKPTVSAISAQTTNEDLLLGPIAFTVADDGGAGTLVVTATSGNTALVPNASIVIGGSGANRTLTITPTLNANSSANGGPAIITLSVSDGGNSTTIVFSLTVAAVNDAPTIGLPVAQTLAEDGSLTLSGVNAPQVADVDAGNASVQLTLAVTHGLLTLSQTTGLAFSSGNGSGNASMTLSGSLSAINAALAGLQYRPIANYNGPDQLTLTANDLGNSGAGGAQVTVANLAIGVTAVNDAPTIAVPPAQSVNEDGLLTLGGAAAPSIADVDAGAAPLQLNLHVSNGQLTLSQTTGLTFSLGSGSNNADMTFSGSQAAINAALAGLQYRPGANYNGPDQLDLNLNDLGNAGAGGPRSANASLAIAVAAVNDAPTVSVPPAQSVNEDGLLTLGGAGAPSIADLDAGTSPVQLTLNVSNGLLTLSQTTGLSFVSGTGVADAGMVFSGTQAAINAALAGLQYRPNLNYNGTDQLNLSVNDLGNTGAGGSLSASASVAITVNAIDDAPVLGLPGTQATPLATPLVFSAVSGNAILVTDVDAGSSVIQVTLSTVAQGNGTLALGNTAGLALVTGNGTSLLVLRGSQANLNAALNTLSFTASVSALARIDISADDLGNTGGGGAQLASGAVTIQVDAGFPPVLTLSRSSLAFTENDPATALDSALTLSDSDSPTLASASIRIGSGFAGAQDLLVFTNLPGTMGNISGSYSTGILTLNSSGATATLAQWQAALRSVNYFNGSEAPSPGTRTVALTVNDGLADSPAVMLAINVAAVNDAPVLAGANNLASIAEDPASNPGTLVSSLIAGHVSDVDAAPLVGIAVTAVNNSNGNWQYSTDGSSWNALGGVTDFSARLLAADAVTAVRFLPNANWNGTVGGGLTLRAWDQTSGAAGGTANASVNGASTGFSSAAASIAVTVTPVNDAPVLASAIAGQTTAQDAPFSFNLAPGSFSDVDGDPLTYAATLSGGAALPSWLSFNAATQTFTGTPGNADVGSLVLRVTATDGSGTSASGDFNLTVTNVNDAPVLAAPIADHSVDQGLALSLTLPGGTFRDVDMGDTLSYSATLTSGAALPSWLSFNAATQTFTGTPANADVGLLAIRVTATDGASASVFNDFNLLVRNVNDAPTLAGVIANRTGTQDAPFSFALPAGSFNDIDAGDVLSYGATLSSGAALPAWLRFDAATQTFSGTPGNAAVGQITVRVMATDTAGAPVFGDFNLLVQNVNDPPVLATPIADQSASQDSLFSLVLPANTFTDLDAADVLAYAARLSSGAALPSWLTFDATTQTFSGTPGNSDVGALVVRVTATDGSGAAAFNDFHLAVSDINDAPVLAQAIRAQDAATGTRLSFQLPAATFVDPDVGDSLHYAATLADGSALPAWLGFDTQTRSFAGNPGAADIGRIAVRVTATDSAGSSAQGLFAISVFAPTQAPPVVLPPAPTPEASATPVGTVIEQVASDLAPVKLVATVAAIAADVVPAAPVVTGAAQATVDPAPVEPASHSVGLDIAPISISVDTPAVQDAPRNGGVDATSTRPASRSDAVLADMLVPQFSEISVSSLNQLVRSDELTRKFEEMQRQMQQQGESRSTVIASSILVTGGVSIGYVVWLVRGGVLMSSMLSALPAWQMIDPLPVLAAARIGKTGKGAQEDDAEVERLFDEHAQPAAPVVRPPASGATPDAPAKAGDA